MAKYKLKIGTKLTINGKQVEPEEEFELTETQVKAFGDLVVEVKSKPAPKPKSKSK